MSDGKKNEGFFIVLGGVTALITGIYYFSRPNIAVNAAVGKASLVTTVVLVGTYYIMDIYQKIHKNGINRSKRHKN